MFIPWKLSAGSYRLNHSGLAAKLPLRGTAPGLRGLSLNWNGQRLSWPGPLLAVRTIQFAGAPPIDMRFSGSPPDHRLRAGLLDILLDRNDRFPARVQVYWDTSRRHRIEMQILATTIDEFEKFEVTTWSQVPQTGRSSHRSECLVSVSAHAGRWVDVHEASTLAADWLVVPRDETCAALSLDRRHPPAGKSVLAPPFHSPIVCYRPAGKNWSYIEMSHPEDCIRIVARPRPKSIEWGFGLFGLDIEKGVILRGRILGAFIPRRRDLHIAEKIFGKFLAEPPHLSV